MAVIVGIDRGGVARKYGIKVGDVLLGFNGIDFADILDYHYYDGMDNFVCNISRGKERLDIEINKSCCETLGLEFGDEAELSPKRCHNKCKFCFVDQLPKGMRDTLYVKDDDYRLSFVSGNYITLTNVFDKELERIIRLKLSPLYVSVHATDSNIKNQLVTNPEAAKMFEKLQLLTKNGIEVNTQIVLCPNENDGDILVKTLDDLATLKPMLKSCAVVPVGLTKHREGLYPLVGVDKQKARECINIICAANEKYGKFAYPSDEFYILADMPLPPYDFYGDFDQIENGVGLIREFEDGVALALDEAKQRKSKSKVSLITGVSFAPFLRGFCDKIQQKFVGLQCDVVAVKNEFFGQSITVAGLITAGDIIKQCCGKLHRDVIIPSSMLKEFSDMFLDGVTTRQLARKLGVRLHICSGGYDLVKIMSKLR